LSHILFGVSLEVAAGKIVCLLGRNGAGKSTTMKSIMALRRRAKAPSNSKAQIARGKNRM
jgi:branched-chain amino acid transport system ATP-binding protein